MGLFIKTYEEAKKDEENRVIIKLRDKISFSNDINAYTTNFLIKYLNDIINEKRKNDFYDTEFLCAVIEQLNVNTYQDGSNVEEHLKKIFACLNDLFPFGKRTKDYENIKDYFIHYFVAPEGYIDKGLYDFSIYNKVNNISDYQRIMKSISNNNIAVENFEKVKKYINSASKWNITTDEYRNTVLATINGLNDSVINIDNYFAEQIEDAKRKAGVYSISHDDIVEAASLFNKMNGKIEEMSITIDQLNEKKNEVVNTADLSVQRVIDETEKSLKKIRNERQVLVSKIEEYLKKQQENLLDKLDTYIETLKTDLNVKADTIFSEILSKYQEQLKDFRANSENYASANARSLAQLKDETEKSLNTLRSFRDNPQLQTVLDQIDQGAELRDRILEMIKLNQELMETPGYKETLLENQPVEGEKVVKGIDRIVVPNNPKVNIPDSINASVNVQVLPIYIYETEKDYEKIMTGIKNKMQENEKNGEYYHQKTLEIIRCLISGEWPYMFGPSGAGKGHIVKQIGKLLGQNVIETGKIGDEATLFGYIDAQGKFRATPVFEACVNGGLLFLDEFDSGNPTSRVALNMLYSSLRDKILDPTSIQYQTFANEYHVQINPNMRMIAAGNTDGSGDDENYNERYKTDESIMERYKVIYIAYDSKLEANILREYKGWYKFFLNFRKACEDYAVYNGNEPETAQGNASTRDASDLLRAIRFNSKPLDEIITQYFVQIKDKEYRGEIAKSIAEKYNLSSDLSDIGDYKGKLAKATEKEIAQQFIKRCNTGIRV